MNGANELSETYGKRKMKLSETNGQTRIVVIGNGLVGHRFVGDTCASLRPTIEPRT